MTKLDRWTARTPDAVGTADGNDLLTVGRVAEVFGVTVRTLHHYDQIGLLHPIERSAAGYRLYTAADISRLARIVVYRRLELSLERIAELLDDPGSDVVTHLRRQREVVTARLEEMSDLVQAIDNALEKEMSNQPATEQDMKNLFGESFDDYQDEAEQRWGQTQEWEQSQQRTKGYTKADWGQVKAETDAIQAAFVAAKRAGQSATGQAAMDAAEQHRQHIQTRFYDCPPSFHKNLGDLYLNDPRYLAGYEGALAEPDIAQYIHDAIHANAARQGA